MLFVRKLIWGAVGRFAWRKGREYWRQRQRTQRAQRAGTRAPGGVRY
jgi:hypothetical protein